MGIAPFLTTAPKIKIVIGEKTVAFAIGLNINISVDVQPIFAFGQYNAISLEPVMVNPVAGTLQILKIMPESFSKERNDWIETNNADVSSYKNSVTDATNYASQSVINGEGVVTKTSGLTSSVSTNNPLSYSNLAPHLDPDRVLSSITFNLDIHMKVLKSGFAEGTTEYDWIPWFRVKDVRLTSKNTNITFGQIINEPVSFQGLMASPLNPTDSKTAEWTYDSGVQEK
jgi:hypothetical protein